MIKGMNDIQHMKQKLSSRVCFALFGCMIACLLLLVGCGAPQTPQHPLSSAEDTPTTESTAVGTPVNSHIKPIQVTQSNLTGYPGGQMTMTISTSPSAVCTFSVSYGMDKPSADIGIVPVTAHADGTASWTWRVDSNARTGTWPLTLTAEFPDSNVKTSMKVNVTVTFPPISVSSPTNIRTYPKNDMVLTIATAPNVNCVLALNYGPSRPIKYLQSGSDANGVASWTWHVDAAAPVGTWPLTITVTLADGEQTSSSISMTVL